MIKVVIFDSDGMITHGPRFSIAYSEKFQVPIESMLEFFNGPFNDCLVGKADLKEELSKGWLKKWHWTGSVDELLVFWFGVGDDFDSEIFNTVKELHNKGIVCILATNQEKYRIDYLVNKFNYREVFSEVFSSAGVGFKKPQQEFFDAIFEYLKKQDQSLEKNEVLFWDDDEKNINGAREYGFTAEMFVDKEGYLKRIKSITLA